MMDDNSLGLVSIIMAAYNAEKTIADSIESVIGQEYTEWELLIVDDCSKDHTVNIINSYLKIDDRIRLIKNQTNKGVSLTRKIAAENAKGDWIAVLDSDDLWTRDKLRRQAELYKITKAEVMYTGSAFITENGKEINWILEVPDKIEYTDLLKHNLISNSSSLVKKKLYLDNYSIGDNMHEDYAIWLKILKQGTNAYGVNRPLLIYRISKSSKSGNKLRSAFMNWNTYKYCGLSIFPSLYYMCNYTVYGIKKSLKLRINTK